ncbi:MAG TPA: aminotransferase class III-fold pyridoxal phosphate-dependent enzyme [Acidimicrobiales bacterium]|nr:aminotransferase class III-fold pyridoxal phosphate-dependent enzyme [Acidimicrobiales bacterium]
MSRSVGPDRFAESEAWWERAQRVIPLGTQTLSKSPTQFVQGAHPIFIERGRGAHLFDVDGNEWIDEPMALGPIVLGYADPVVDEAIRRQLEAGITFTLMHHLEVEVAERIVELCPGVEAVRFAKTGSDVLSGAVRAARAGTGRDVVLVAGYHGWHDWYIGTTTRRLGVPEAVTALVREFHFNDLEHLESCLTGLRGRVAAVVLEPAAAEVPEPGFLEGVVELAAAHGAWSVFDEVITGFRLAPGGARERYGVIPDLSCYGKALGNGMPISAVAGGWSAMRWFEEVFFSGTHGGEALSLAAAAAVLDTVADGRVLKEIEARGERLLDGLRRSIGHHGVEHLVRVGGEPHRGVVGFAGEDPLVTKSWVQQCQAEHGCLFNGSLFICARHTDADVDRMLEGFDRAFAVLAAGEDVGRHLVGPAVTPVFRTP